MTTLDRSATTPPTHSAGRTPATTSTTHHGAESVLRPSAARVAATLRIAYGLIFLWAFIDKIFGLGYATPAGKGWLDGGNPTKGFLSSAEGPFAGFYHAIAGQAWVNWSFMLALLALGVALVAGIAMRLAAIGGAVLYLMMWSVALPPATNPFLDDHLLGGLTLVLLTLIGAGTTWGLGRAWNQLGIVQRFPILR